MIEPNRESDRHESERQRPAPDETDHTAAPEGDTISADASPNSRRRPLEELVDGFVPTRQEVTILARNHLDAIYQGEFEYFAYSSVSMSAVRYELWAHDRLAVIEEAIGKTEIEKALERVHMRWQPLIDEVRAIYQREGIECLDELPDNHPDFVRITNAAGFIAIPFSAMHPVEELVDPLDKDDEARHGNGV